ncbi:MAG: hypothetical protein MI861_08345, partial [Pirellulales bacterium]|nr:hypothetical protein [Pirellulales bacterium]
PQTLSPDIVQSFPDMGWPVKSLEFSPDDRWLVVGKQDQKILLLDLKSGQTLSSVQRPNGFLQVEHVRFSRSGNFVIAAGPPRELAVWPVDEHGKLGTMRSLTSHRRKVEVIAVSSNADFAITGTRGEIMWQTFSDEAPQVRRLDALSGAVVALHLPSSGVEALATDGEKLVRFDLRQAKVLELKELSSGYRVVHAAAFSPDGTKLALSRGRTIVLLDTASGKTLSEFDTDQIINWSLSFFPDGNHLACGSRGVVDVWNIQEEPKLAKKLSFGGPFHIKTIAVSHNGKLVAGISASAGQTLQVVRVDL